MSHIADRSKRIAPKVAMRCDTQGMSRTPAQRGPFGNWLKEAREARYSTQEKAREDLRRLTGVTIVASEWAAWESGSRVPRPENPKARALVDFFGGDPWAAYKESPADATPAGLFNELLTLQQQLIVAFETQAAAVMALVQEIRLSRAAEVEDILARLRAVEATQRLLHSELEDPVSAELPAPRRSEG